MSWEIEQTVTDAFIAAIEAVEDFEELPVRMWKDASENEVYPVILVHASEYSAEKEDPNSGELFEVLVDLGCRTSENYDQDRKVLSGWMGKLNALVFSKTSPLIAALNAQSESLGLRFVGFVFTKGSSGTADGINTGSITLQMHVQKIEEVES
jgi:hypothetical protein